MAPLKTWAPGDRLTAADLNAAFAEVAGNRFPMCVAGVGSQVNLTAATVTTVNANPPAANGDPAGYWNATQSNFVVPAGFGGIHLVQAALFANPGGAKGDIIRFRLSGGGQPNTFVSFPRLPAAGQFTGGNLTQVFNAGTGAIVAVEVWSETAASVLLTAFNIVRLGAWGLFT